MANGGGSPSLLSLSSVLWVLLWFILKREEMNSLYPELRMNRFTESSESIHLRIDSDNTEIDSLGSYILNRFPKV